MTRARDELRLMVPQRFYVHQQTQYGDRHVYASRSRFIPNALTPLFDARAWPAPEADAQAHISSLTPTTVIDIARRVRVRWQQAG